MLKLLTGNPGRRPITVEEFRPLTEVPNCPAHLQGEARREWRRLTRELVRYGMISRVDRGTLATLCTVWARYVHAEEMIAKDAAKDPEYSGMYQPTSTSYMAQSPWLAISNKSIELYRQLMAEFGMSPASRSKVAPSAAAALPGAAGSQKRGFEEF